MKDFIFKWDGRGVWLRLLSISGLKNKDFPNFQSNEGNPISFFVKSHEYNSMSFIFTLNFLNLNEPKRMIKTEIFSKFLLKMI